MKKTLTLIVALFINNCIMFAQAPQKMSYQAVIRNNSNALVTSTAVGMKISILQGSATGTNVYTETQTPTSNANGLVSLEIGAGTVVSGSFAYINWASGLYFIKTETDPNGGTTYSITGTSQLLSVPYALYAETSGTPGIAGTTGATGATGIAGTNGLNGTDGTAGSAGAVGQTGTTGADGTIGATGTTGAAGIVGATGATGADGIVGSTGATGFLQNGSIAGNTAYWDGSSWITNNSNIYNNGGNIGIGTTTPANKLDVEGGVSIGTTYSGTSTAPANGAIIEGNVSIGTVSPNATAKLHVDLGTSTTNGILITGTYNTGSTIPDLGAGTRMMFYPGKAAFRAGLVAGTQWDNANVGLYSTALGVNNIASGSGSTVLGYSNTASGLISTATGRNNIASGDYSTALGYGNTASGNNSTAMGEGNTAGHWSTAMGYANMASGMFSVAMGQQTTASGQASTAMGYGTIASGNFTTAMGYYVSTNANAGAFIIGDGSTTNYTNSSAANQMTMRFAGGYRLYSNTGLTAGVTLAAGAGAWASVSDKRKKENFISLNPEEVLLKVKNLPVTEWNYKSQDITNHHIGPMAQDFYAAFKLSGNGNDTTITTSDIDGVNMIAIQALEIRTAQLKLAQDELITKTNELEKLRTELENFKKDNTEFRNKFSKLENEIEKIQQRNVSASKGK